MRYLFIAGAVPFIVLGVLHIIYTILDERRPCRIAPRDPHLLEQMRAGSLFLTRQTTVWRAWLGFNLSHGLGVVLFAGILIHGAALHFDAVRSAAPELLFAVPVIASLYFLMSLRYWFRIPAIGTGLGTAVLLAGAVLAAM
jgi:hypothetical protein